MPKPACASCQRFLRPLKNGVKVLEGKPVIHGTKPGKSEDHLWDPYKLWLADLWHCEGCGLEVIVGYGVNPVMQDYCNTAEEMQSAATHRVNDC